MHTIYKLLFFKKINEYIFSAYFASIARAKTPAASGAAADVPECVLVHLPYRSVVATPGFLGNAVTNTN